MGNKTVQKQQATYTNLGDAFRECVKQREENAIKHPRLLKAIATYKYYLEQMEIEKKWKLKNMDNGQIIWDAEGIEQEYRLRISNYKRQVSRYLNDTLSYVTNYLNDGQKKAINKECGYKMFDIK